MTEPHWHTFWNLYSLTQWEEWPCWCIINVISNEQVVGLLITHKFVLCVWIHKEHVNVVFMFFNYVIWILFTIIFHPIMSIISLVVSELLSALYHKKIMTHFLVPFFRVWRVTGSSLFWSKSFWNKLLNVLIWHMTMYQCIIILEPQTRHSYAVAEIHLCVCGMCLCGVVLV